MKTIIITLGSIQGEGVKHKINNVTCLGDALATLQNLQPLAKLSDITAVDEITGDGKRPYQFKEADHRAMIDALSKDTYASVDRFKQGIRQMSGERI